MSEQSMLEKAAEKLGVDVDDLKKSVIGELLGDFAPAQKEAPAKLTAAQKLDALAKEVEELKAAVKALPPFPPKPGTGMEEDEGMPPKKKKTKKDDDEADAEVEAKALPPFLQKPGDKEDEMPPKKDKAKAKKDDGDDSSDVEVQKSLPWPKDMASKNFRAGQIEQLDPARDWGKDPWADQRTG